MGLVSKDTLVLHWCGVKRKIPVFIKEVLHKVAFELTVDF